MFAQFNYKLSIYPYRYHYTKILYQYHDIDILYRYVYIDIILSIASLARDTGQGSAIYD